MKTVKVYKTENNSILIVTATTHQEGKKQYVSVTASEIEPVLKEDAIKQCREQLEDGEYWKQAVQAGQTELSLKDWVEMVIDNDGELSGFDNSLYTDKLTINKKDFIFNSSACGCLHDEINAVTNEFKELIKLHLKDSPAQLAKADKIINSIKSDDIDFEVEKITREIFELI